MRLLLTFILILIAVPVWAQPPEPGWFLNDPEVLSLQVKQDTIEIIADEYRTTVEAYREDRIGPGEFKGVMNDLHIRAKWIYFKSFYEYKKERGLLKPGETVADQKFGLFAPDNTEDGRIFNHILQFNLYGGAGDAT